MFSKSSATNSSQIHLTATPSHAGLQTQLCPELCKKVTAASKNEKKTLKKTVMSQAAEGASDFWLSQSKRQFSKVEKHHLHIQIISEETLNSGIFLFHSAGSASLKPLQYLWTKHSHDPPAAEQVSKRSKRLPWFSNIAVAAVAVAAPTALLLVRGPKVQGGTP